MTAAARESSDFEFVREIVARKSGVVLDAGKDYLVRTRLKSLVDREGLPSLEALVLRLRAQPFGTLLREVVEALLTTETMWFRDQHPFETLHREVVPALAGARRDERRLRIWSAATSTGQEPYSIALTLREHCPQLAGWDVSILASDLSTEMLGRARQATYNEIEIHRGLPPAVRDRWFERAGPAWRLRPEIRDMVWFRQINLIEPLPDLPPMDVVFLRNVLIYFDVRQKAAVLDQVRRVLRPDGWLFMGGSETTLNLTTRFVRVAFPGANCYRCAP